jgi:hypothetical protein
VFPDDGCIVDKRVAEIDKMAAEAKAEWGGIPNIWGEEAAPVLGLGYSKAERRQAVLDWKIRQHKARILKTKDGGDKIEGTFGTGKPEGGRRAMCIRWHIKRGQVPSDSIPGQCKICRGESEGQFADGSFGIYDKGAPSPVGTYAYRPAPHDECDGLDAFDEMTQMAALCEKEGWEYRWPVRRAKQDKTGNKMAVSTDPDVAI